MRRPRYRDTLNSIIPPKNKLAIDRSRRQVMPELNRPPTASMERRWENMALSVKQTNTVVVPRKAVTMMLTTPM